ncbi:uncharacterized protein LOC116620363 [Nematostella vectensis]|uniref:uncharacterized protein LOC116620363 n=1 Tax=Nematostella vectensis TaxID=45351 RepID=UPI00138F9F92|nr:uncharacterized protein LOC116620363 [Nematostella vectensis]
MQVTLLTLRRALDGFILVVLGIISLALIYRPDRLFPGLSSTRTSVGNRRRFILSLEFNDDGFHFKRHRKERFMSYEPPVGSWSDQLLAFQNAVIIAALLNRTLLAQPLFSELESKRLRKHVREDLKSDSEVFKLINTKFLVPISAVIDLSRLSHLIRVNPIQTSHAQFLENYKNLTWHSVCHKSALGFWLDFIPSPENSRAWNILQKQTFLPLKTFFSGVEPVCEQELEMVDSVKNSAPLLRGILTELAFHGEDLIYFRGGSLATRELRFLSKKRTAQAQKWVSDFIRFSPYLLKRMSQMAENIRKPYNAVFIAPSKNPDVFNNNIRYRLREMEKRKFRSISNRLYIGSSQVDLRDLKGFMDLGYELYSPKDIIPEGISEHIKYDVRKLLGELLCKFAILYEGPMDTFATQRARLHEARRMDDLLIDHISVKWAGHTIKRPYMAERKEEATTKPESDGLRVMFCRICKTMQIRLKNATCRPILSDCKKRKI